MPAIDITLESASNANASIVYDYRTGSLEGTLQGTSSTVVNAKVLVGSALWPSVVKWDFNCTVNP